MLPLLPPCAESNGGVMSVKCCLGEEHVAARAAGVGLVDLLQDHYFILHVTFYKVEPGVGPNRPPPPTVLYRACHCPRIPQKVNPVLYWRRGSLHPLWFPSPYVLHMMVCRQGPFHQIFPAVRALEPILLPHQIVKPPPAIHMV